MQKFHNPAALLLAVSCTSVFAADEPAAPVIITATRTAQSADATLASVTVITREDLEREQALSVQDALRGIPGVGIDNNGGSGKTTYVFMRGSNPDHVLVLVDGIKIGSATAGITALQDIPIDQIDRIEVVRGPLSSLYGSEAIGGVIQIFTRKGGGALTPAFNLGIGRYRSFDASAGISGGGDNGWFNVRAGALYTQGFNACNGDLTTYQGCATHEPDKDGNRNRSASARAGYRFGQGIESEVFLLQTQGRSEFDASDDFDSITFQSFELGPNHSRVLQRIGGVSVKAAPIPMWHTTLTAGRSLDESDNYKSGSIFDSRFDTRRDTWSWQNDFALSETQIFTAGLDYQKDHVDSTTPYTKNTRDNRGVLLQHQMNAGVLDTLLSMRRDDNAQFGRHATGNATLGYALNSALRLTASYGTAFKAPTFNELYWPLNEWGQGGNPNLNPEKSRSIELGLRAKATHAAGSLSVYETRINNLIAGWPPVNISKAHILGLEAGGSLRHDAWSMAANMTLLAPKDRSAGTSRGNVLQRRAQRTLRLDLDRALGSLSVGTTIRVEGHRYDDVENTRRLSGYATLDLRTEYSIDQDWRVQARVENTFDKDYRTAAYYNQPGSGVYLTLRYQPTTK